MLIIFQDSLVINISGRSQFIPLLDQCQYFLFHFHFLSNISGLHLVMTCVQGNVLFKIGFIVGL